MKIGDIIWRNDYGVGKVVGFETCLAPCLVYFYKENRCLHNGNGRGPDCHYWLCMENSLTLVRSVSLCKLIERRRNATS
jgi:hypothetical protein|nr:MAG TPA: CarD-like protein [Caudoviricetes sp.]